MISDPLGDPLRLPSSVFEVFVTTLNNGFLYILYDLLTNAFLPFSSLARDVFDCIVLFDLNLSTFSMLP